MIDRIRPDIATETISGSLALSARQIERLFQKVYGLAPKTYLRINRFQAALDYASRTDDISWSEISQTFGYYDQAHLCREFKKFTGMAPQEYFNYFTA